MVCAHQNPKGKILLNGPEATCPVIIPDLVMTSKEAYPSLTPADMQREHAFFRVIVEEADEHWEQAGKTGVRCKIAVVWQPGWFVGMRYRTDGKYNGVLDAESVCGDAVPHQDACEWTMLKVALHQLLLPIMLLFDGRCQKSP